MGRNIRFATGKASVWSALVSDKKGFYLVEETECCAKVFPTNGMGVIGAVPNKVRKMEIITVKKLIDAHCNVLRPKNKIHKNRKLMLDFKLDTENQERNIGLLKLEVSNAGNVVPR